MHISFKPPTIAPITPIDTSSLAPTQSTGSTNFRDILSGAIDEVETSRNDAKQSVDRFLSGEGDDLHSTILAGQRADLEFQMFLQVRNKVVSAYQEVMRMQM
jgi:flagellar hook-basal body complex protein FliE